MRILLLGLQTEDVYSDLIAASDRTHYAFRRGSAENYTRVHQVTMAKYAVRLQKAVRTDNYWLGSKLLSSERHLMWSENIEDILQLTMPVF